MYEYLAAAFLPGPRRRRSRWRRGGCPLTSDAREVSCAFLPHLRGGWCISHKTQLALPRKFGIRFSQATSQFAGSLGCRIVTRNLTRLTPRTQSMLRMREQAAYRLYATVRIFELLRTLASWKSRLSFSSAFAVAPIALSVAKRSCRSGANT